ncbi:MAG: RDD family protein [Proteobacteria bacterium]|nr:RDD family protein [Pseudomonadota bacterium]
MITFSTEYAGFGRRAIAFTLDFIWLYFLLVFLLFLSYDPVVFTEITEFNHISQWQTALIFLGLPALIIIWFWIKFATTPGKLLLDCEIVDAKTGKPITFKQSILRYIGYFISAIPFFLGFFWILVDKHHQTWHDKIAGTVVIIHDESQVPLYKLIEGYP